jgi:predicted MFS family arabinose efflux permease
VGGVVTDVIGWRAVFWGYVPVAVVLAAAILRTVPRDRSGSAALPLNVAGSALFTAAAMAFIVGTTLLPERGKAVAAAVTLVAAVVLALVFLDVDRRAAAPLLPRSVVCLPPLRAGASGSFLNTFTTSSSVTLATLYLQNTLGRSPLDAASLLLPFSLAVIGGSALAAPLLSRWAPRRVVAAGLLAIAAFNCLLIVAAGSAWGLPLTVAAGGFGIGLSSVAATSLATTVPTEVRGTASGIVNTAAQLGTALGIAVLLLIAAITTGAPAKDTSAPTVAWVFGAAASLTGALTFMMSARRSPADVDFGTDRGRARR